MQQARLEACGESYATTCARYRRKEQGLPPWIKRNSPSWIETAFGVFSQSQHPQISIRFDETLAFLSFTLCISVANNLCAAIAAKLIEL
jgi:hypothetical protein